MCLLLVACSNSAEKDSTKNSDEPSSTQAVNKKAEAENAIIGTWERVSQDGVVVTLTFYDDHTVVSRTEQNESTGRANWKYDEELGCYMMINPDYVSNAMTAVTYCTIVNDNGTVFLSYNGYRYFPQENNK